MKKKEKKEAKRGPGQPKKEPTRTKTFRFNEKDLDAAEERYGRKLNRLANHWLKSICGRHE